MGHLVVREPAVKDLYEILIREFIFVRGGLVGAAGTIAIITCEELGLQCLRGGRWGNDNPACLALLPEDRWALCCFGKMFIHASSIVTTAGVPLSVSVAQKASRSTMKSVIFNGPYKVVVEDRPKPKIQAPTDVIVKVSVAGICGSELHAYRGHQNMPTGGIMGHEFVGVVEEIGEDVKALRVGQKVVSTFSAICMDCWFCRHGHTNRCQRGAAFGTPALDGGQAEYVRVPFADGTIQPVPAGVDEQLLIMMCDILPTGYYGTSRAIAALMQQNVVEDRSDDPVASKAFVAQSPSEAVFVVLGCGPVGLCAILSAKAKGVVTVYAVDSVDERLAEAERFGAIPLKLGKDDVKAAVHQATEGRGADAVIEVVGNKPALRSAFDILRICGVLSSLGFHQGELPFTAAESYAKNLNMNLGRAPVRTVFAEALKVLIDNQDILGEFISHRLPLVEAAEGFRMFEKAEARKVVLIP